MRKHILLSLLLITCLLSCDKEEADRGFARVNTLRVGMITTNGVNIKGEIYDAGSKTIEDHGFIYNLKTIEINTNDTSHFEGSFEKESLGSTSGNSVFETRLTRNLIKGESYLAKAYAVTDGTIVYGEIVEFISHGGLGPVITSFSPDTLEYGDTLSIKGDNFSIHSINNQVFFDQTEAKIITSTDTSLKVVFPKGPRYRKCPIKVVVAKDSITSGKKMIIAAPKIDSISKSIVLSGDPIKIYGKNFSHIRKVYVGESLAMGYYNLHNQGDSILSFSLPGYMPIGKHDLKIEYLDDTITFPKRFETILPTIDSFSPKKIWLDSVITIRGTNLTRFGSFSLANNHVYDITDTIAYCKIYNVPRSKQIFGYYDSHKILSKDSIEWIQPKADSFSENTAVAGESVYLHGDNFFVGIDVYFGDTKAPTGYVDKKTLKVTIPEIEAGTYQVSFRYYYTPKTIDPTIKGKASISVPQIKINNITPLQVKKGSDITLTVDDANLSGYIKVYVDGNNCKIKEKSGNTIKATVPVDYCLSPSPKVSAKIGGQEIEYPTPLQLNDPWICLSDADYKLNDEHITHWNGKQVAILKNKAANQNRGLYVHNGNNQWSHLSDLDYNGPTQNMHAYKDKIYLSVSEYYGTDILYSYSNSNKEWIRIDTIPVGSVRYSFLIDGKLFLGNNEKMCYRDLNKEEWVMKSAVPSSRVTIERKVEFQSGKNAYLGIYITTNGSNGNFVEENEFWKYNSENDTWEQLGQMPVELSFEATAAVHNEKVYIVGRGYQKSKTFWEYDISSNNWQELIPPPGAKETYASFIINDEYFFCCDHYIDYNNGTIEMSKVLIQNMLKKD